MDKRLMNGWASGLVIYVMTGMVVVIGVLFGQEFVTRCNEHSASRNPTGVLSGFVAWDGYWYTQIVDSGYQYRAGKRSNIGFFPAYPAVAALVAYITHVPSEAALLVVSNVCFALAFVVFARYMAFKPKEDYPQQVEWTLLALGACPWTFFFRMAYSESLFLLLILLSLMGMQRHWKPIAIAGIIGAATATRVMGLALLVPFAMYLWSKKRTLFGFAVDAAISLPVSVWGISAFILFQAIQFGEPLAYVKVQQAWHSNPLPVNFSDAALRLVTFQPLIATYYPSQLEAYWGNMPPRDMPLFNLGFMNPIVFFGSALLVGVGWRAGWLTKEEIALAAALLVMAYALQGIKVGMISTARYASVAFPVYIVLGKVLSRLNVVDATAILGLAAVFLACYSSLFSTWYWFY